MKQKENDVTNMRNTIKLVWNTVTSILVGLMVILVALLWGFQLLGYELLVIQSGSMEPNYRVGSLVYVKPVDAAELEVGDVITFELGNGVRGTHRIVEVLKENDSLAFKTKGDSNDYVDANPVQPQSIVGQVKFAIPFLGFLIAYMQQPPGTYFTISAMAVLLLLTILPNLIFPKKNKEKKQEDDDVV